MDLLKLNFLSLDLCEQTSEDRRKRGSETKQLKIITLDQLACHDRADDCWVAIYDCVYDCTEFVKKHPGGLDILVEYAGRDATLAFVGAGHSPHATTILENYLIGELPLHERLFVIPNGIKIVSLDS